MRRRASPISSSTAAICSAIDASATVRGTSGTADSSDVEEAIAIPAVCDAGRLRRERLRPELARVGEPPEHGARSRGRPQDLAVDEKMDRIVEQLRATVQAQAVARGAQCERGE